MKIMKKVFSYLTFVVAALLTFTAHAQDAAKKPASPATAFVFATGQSGQTYDTVMNELLGSCNPDKMFSTRAQSGGSPVTISEIAGNKIVGGPVQYDVLWMRSKNQDLTNMKLLVPLHSEQVLFIALNKPLKSGGVMGIGGNTNNLGDIRALSGLTVAAAAGSVYTAEAINGLGKIGFMVNNQFDNTDSVIEAVRSGKAAAGVVVGGFPVAKIASLTKEFRLIPFDAATVKAVENVYRTKNVVYDNLGTASVATVEVDAYLMVYDYKGKRMIDALTNLRNCFNAQVADISETPGTHAAWRSVVSNRKEKTRWPVYESK